jgi:hypothetical protein
MNFAIFWDMEPCNPYVIRSPKSIFRAENLRIKKPACSVLPSHLLASWFLARLIFGSEDGFDTFLLIVGSHTDYITE